jgi:hypothetical protein
MDEKKYLKYKIKYLELKNQKGGKVGDFYDYSKDYSIKKLFYVKSDKTLNIYYSLTKHIQTSPIIKFAVVDNKWIFITESGSVYVTRKPTEYDVFPAFTKYDGII